MGTERKVVGGRQMGKGMSAQKEIKAGLSVAQRKKAPSVSGQLTVGQTVRLLEVGAACRVKVLRFRDLCVTFGEEQPKAEAGLPAPSHSPQPKVRSPEELERVERSGRVAERDDLVSDELEHLKITDPAAYETFVQSEDAEDGDGDSGA